MALEAVSVFFFVVVVAGGGGGGGGFGQIPRLTMMKCCASAVNDFVTDLFRRLSCRFWCVKL